MQEPFTLYKLIILFMLDSSDYPLSSSHIADFILSGGYTDYLTLRNALGELEDGGLVSSQTVRNRTLLSNTEEGRRTLSFFVNDINAALRKDIESFLSENKLQTEERSSILADYKLLSDGEYEVTLSIKEKSSLLTEIKIRVPLEEIAISACAKWSEVNTDIYKFLIDKLY